MTARTLRSVSLAAALLVALAGTRCQKVPLLAPTGSSITLVAGATALPVNGTTQIIAQVIEPSGTAPHSGTEITFTTTLGSMQPATVSTDVNGRAVATFNAGTSNGTATISALSGGSSVGANGAVKIAVGTAAVGHVNLSALPATIPATGGTSTVTASVFDINGNPLPNALVSFSTTAGSLSTGAVNTDQNGLAQTILTTGLQATVTGSVGGQAGAGTGTGTGSGTGTGTGTTTPPPTTSGQASGTVTVTIATAPGLTITPPTTANAGVPAAFTFTVAAAGTTGSPVRDVTVNWGDGGATEDLGTITGAAPVAHVYNTAGTYHVIGTATDITGAQSAVSTFVVVVATPSPTVVVTPTVPNAGHPVTVSFQVQVTVPTGVGIASAVIDWGDGTPGNPDVSNLGGLSGSVTLSHVYQNSGTFLVTLTVTDTLGRTTPGTAVVTVS